MVFKIATFVCIQLAIFNTAYSQVLNRIGPNCGCSNILPVEPILQSPCLLNSPVVYSNELPGRTTIIQDSTIANNLANALQLLVVSNLLSNTLPLGNCGCGCGYPLDFVPIVAPGCGCGCSPIVAPSCGCGCGYPPVVAPSCGCGCGYPLDVTPGCGCGLGGYGPCGYNVLY